MDQQDKKLLLSFFVIIISAIGSIIVVDFLYRIDFIDYASTGNTFHDTTTAYIIKLRPKLHQIIYLFIISLAAMSMFQKNEFIKRGTNYKMVISTIALLSAAVLILGYNSYLYYNIIIFPIGFVSAFYLIPKTFSFIQFNTAENQKPTGISKKEDEEYSFYFKTNKGKLIINNPRQGVWVEGGAGAGKSASVIIPIIVQAVNKGFAGLIYDFEGDLTEGGGLLTKVAYTAIEQSKSNVKFAFINFTDLSRTMRCNPFGPQYIKSSDHALEIATIIMFNLEKDWAKKRDFWANNAIATYAAAVWFFHRNHPEFCTIPHITEFILNDFYQVLNILATDDDTAKMIAPVIGALKRDAAGQLAGAEASTQLPMTKLRSKNLYWVLNPDHDNEFSLDITNKDQPVLLSIGNSPELRNAYAPAIGAIMQVCKMQMNKLGKNKSIFLVDELPTVYIDKLDQLPAEARKKGVCTILAAQTYAQLERDYGKENSEVIVDNMGNQIVGMASTKTAEKLSKMMGDYEKPHTAQTSSDSGESQTLNTKTEKVTKISDITGQDIGHFSGKIAGGKPPMFQAQFDYFDYKTKDIPFFSMPMPIEDEQEAQTLLNNLVDENYEQVKQDINQLLQKGYSQFIKSK